MTILVTCDHPNCVQQAAAIRVDAMGRLHMPQPWVIFGGGDGSRTLTVCKAEHIIGACETPTIAPKEL
jgi:hypothetical protein